MATRNVTSFNPRTADGAVALVAVLAAVAACGSPGSTVQQDDGGRADDARADTGENGRTDGAPADGAGRLTCAEMAARFPDHSGRVCVETVPDEETWLSITAAESGADLVRSTKFFLPWRADVRIPPSFLDASFWATVSSVSPSPTLNPWHYLFATVFLQASTPIDAYRGTNREAVAGNVMEMVVAGQEAGKVYAYDVLDPAPLTCAQQMQLHEQMRSAFRLVPLSRLVMSDLDATPPGCPIPVIVVTRPPPRD